MLPKSFNWGETAFDRIREECNVIKWQFQVVSFTKMCFSVFCLNLVPTYHVVCCDLTKYNTNFCFIRLMLVNWPFFLCKRKKNGFSSFSFNKNFKTFAKFETKNSKQIGSMNKYDKKKWHFHWMKIVYFDKIFNLIFKLFFMKYKTK